MKKKLRFSWDVIIVLAATFAALYVPVKLVLPLPHESFERIADWGLTLMFSIDLALRFSFRGLVQHLRNRKTGTTRRFVLILLLFDILAALPFFLLPTLPGLELFRLLKLLCIAHFMGDWRDRNLPHANLLRLIFSFYWMFLLINWISSGWISLRGLEEDLDLKSNYLHAVYWCTTTLTTVGYGDITPENDAEKMFAIMLEVMGVIAYGFVIGNITSVLANIDPTKADYISKLERLGAFVKYHNLPLPLKKKIFSYYHYIWEKRIGTHELSFLDSLPPTLRTEISLFMNRDIIEKVPLFRGADEKFIEEIASVLRPVVYLPDDLIAKAGEEGREMYFISRGTAEVSSADDGRVLQTLREGDYFGEIALLYNTPRTANVRAVSFCNLYCLDKSRFDSTLDKFPASKKKIQDLAKERMQESKTPFINNKSGD